ncbi:MAG: O-antigen ligase family protein [Bacteroidales bacterium]|nr:O-antigen ligase family protein [Bacteroidales bacterium]
MQKINNQITNVKFKKWDLFLIATVLLTTVNPFFVSNKYIQLLTFLLIMYRLFQVKKSLYINNSIITLFIFYTFISTAQGMQWNLSIFSILSSFILVYLYAYFLYKLYSFNLFIVLEKVIYTLTVISLILYALHEISAEFGNLLTLIIRFLDNFSADAERHSRSLIIYTYRPAITGPFGFIRNSGFAHEPGAFSLLLSLAISINYLNTSVFLSKRNYVYIFALITAFSTAGLFSLFVLFGLLIQSKSNKLAYIFMYIILLGISFYFFNTSDYMFDKVTEQYDEQSTEDLGQQNSGRFMGLRKSLYVLERHPFTGRGLQTSSMPLSSFDPEYAAYGWYSYISKLGVFAGALFLFLYIRGIYSWIVIYYRKNKYVFIILLLSLFVNLSSQTYITKQFLLIFFFVGLLGFSTQNKSLSHD